MPEPMKLTLLDRIVLSQTTHIVLLVLLVAFLIVNVVQSIQMMRFDAVIEALQKQEQPEIHTELFVPSPGTRETL